LGGASKEEYEKERKNSQAQTEIINAPLLGC
jgi:hypothetical protein